jgi:hypothetical protein
MTEKDIDIILDKKAKKNMIQWSLKGFKRAFPRLYKTIIETVLEAVEINSKIK